MKRLIICCDGTWNAADHAVDDVRCPTDVVRLACRVAKRDCSVPQIVFYGKSVTPMWFPGVHSDIGGGYPSAASPTSHCNG